MGHSNESSYEKEIKKYEIPSFLQNFTMTAIKDMI